MFDNKILISLGGIVLLAPALPFLALMIVGLVVAGFALYYLFEVMEI
ncbi:hypothetical protein J6A31_01255 [bacterium]|nr:hypothetical protein [bacterium]